MIHPPTEPSGSGSSATWFREMLRYCKSLRLLPSPDVHVTHTTDGISLALRRTPGGGGGGSVGISRFAIVSLSEQYLNCHRLGDNGAPDTTTEVQVGKPVELWSAFRSDDGTVEGADATQRTVSIDIGGTPMRWLEQIRPAYLVGDYLVAARLLRVGGQTWDWLDLNVAARRWRMQIRPIKVCMPDQTLKDQAFHSGEDPV